MFNSDWGSYGSWGSWGSKTLDASKELEDMGERLNRQLEQSIMTADTISNATVSTQSTSYAEIQKMFDAMNGVSDEKKIEAVNEILEEKGYPEFDEILKYYLDAHPEYKL